jgi:hypothetical protein
VRITWGHEVTSAAPPPLPPDLRPADPDTDLERAEDIRRWRQAKLERLKAGYDDLGGDAA